MIMAENQMMLFGRHISMTSTSMRTLCASGGDVRHAADEFRTRHTIRLKTKYRVDQRKQCSMHTQCSYIYYYYYYCHSRSFAWGAAVLGGAGSVARRI